MIRRTLATAAVLVGFSFASNAGEPAALKPLSFRAEARVDVDADGKFVRAEASSDLPEPVRRYVEQQLAKWTYKRNDAGAHGIASTWVDLRACAMPTTSGAYSMGLAYNGSGPMLMSAGSPGKMAYVFGENPLIGTILLHIAIGEDGAVTLESIEGGFKGLTAKEKFATAARNWTATLRVRPELVDGKPVRARGTLPLEVKQGRSKRSTKDELLAQALESPQCKQAGQAANAPAMTAIQLGDTDRLVVVQPAI